MKKLLSLSLILSLIVPYTAPLSASLAVETPGNEDSAKIALDNNQIQINSDREQLKFNTNEERVIELARDRDDYRRRNIRRRIIRRGHRSRDDNDLRNKVRRYYYRYTNNNWRDNIRRSRRWRDHNRRRHIRRYNTRRHRTIINRPYYNWYNWRWNNGRHWRPDRRYWGGGFWGSFVGSMVTLGITSALRDANEAPKYVVIKQNTPGYYLFDNYGLTQVPCDTSEDLVFIYGPEDSLMCAMPNENISPGYYDVNTEGLVLILRD